MARAFVSSSSQRLVRTIAERAYFPLTMACWYYPTQDTTSQVLMSLCDYSYQLIQSLRWDAASSKVSAQSRDNVVTGTASVTVTPSELTNKWNFACGTSSGRSDRKIYTGTDTASDSTYGYLTASTADRWVISSHILAGVHYAHFDGYIAHAAVWGDVLTGDQIASLYNGGIGADPRSVRPDALIAYWPLLDNDGDRDRWGTNHLTASGSPTYAKHPPVLMRSRPKYVVLGSAAPSIATIEIAGTRQVGNTLTCNATSSPSGGTFTYQWYMADNIDGLNGTPISGATSQTYELSYANIGAATKLYEGLDSAGEAFIACGATPTVAAVEGDETVSSYVSITEASVTASATSPFESLFIR